ncbi:hypothetical protein HYALB_00012542 [Hymenoscyphus albidus]|uniref:Peptidase S59 domain-containing protein n=1 Tax=Hymenoscyphus albidus TaxID=595503 RepID=A0A9N9Q1S1_9HELO|nr:hypothetical protein HYALB_00012542 [Hymenoscyphus albidus]
MSGFGGFGGFGSNNNTQSTGFGGFGSTPATNTGFGSTPATTGFGASNTTGGGLFGSSTGGFGNSGGAFGSTSSGFGAAKPAFGAANTSSAGSIFGGGSTTATTGGGFGFGQTPPATTGFGAPAASTGGLFGAKPATSFGAANTNPFGGGTSTGFGAAPAASGFGGAPASTALGGVTGTCEGTASTPFQPFVEKEPNSSNNQQNSFQNICFQQPYQKWSPDELRLADYTGGRRYGNGSNQAGAFGTNTGFGGFGASNTASTGFGATNTGTGGLFGSGAATSSPFGTSQPAATGFGANTATAGGGLFGAAKPTTGLFGSTPAQPASNLFGANNTTNAFGSPAAAGGFGTNNTAAGGSLFGNTATANKPASGFSFGNSQPATTSGFGSGTTTGFGGATGGGLFGANNNQQAQNTGSPFGQQQQQPAASTASGGFGGAQAPAAGTSLFGQNQAKPAGGLFGATNTAAPASGGLFGNTANQPAPSGGLFGNAAAQPQQNSLFGAAKPTGTSLFGGAANNTQPSTGGGLFGGFGAQNPNNNQQQNSGGLFGNLGANNNQNKPSLFGNTQNQNSGGTGLFGNSASQPQQGGGGLFGGLGLGNSQQNQQQAQNSFGNSLLSNSQQNQQNSQSLTASISDNAAYGGGSLFGSLANTSTNNPGPVATPLSSSVKRKSTTALPMYKLNTASSSRFSTPQKRPGGFGFSYSQYGTPGGSPSSNSSTPGGGAFGTFGRSTLRSSVSTNNLRRTFGPEDSILAPGAFSASTNSRPYGSTGSVKKLNINRNIRNDLFTPPTAQQSPAAPSAGILKNKRVSFEAHATNGVGVSSPLKHITNGSSPSSEELGLLRPSNPSVNGTNGKSSRLSRADSPEMEQTSNNQLAVVNEELTTTSSPSKPIPQMDQEPGRYYMKPTKEEIMALPRDAQKAVKDFTVGREGIGHVTFQTPVDLTRFNLDEIPGEIIVFSMRSCTVYADPSKKPPMGQGLNVPAIISLQNSWPRKRDGKTPSTEKSGALFKKHVDRLNRVPDTEFRSYDKDTGVWSFSVEHFTTYGFPEEEEETDGEGLSELEQTTLSMAQDTPTPRNSHTHLDHSFASTSQVTHTESEPEDTFDFKRRKVLPGAFDNQEAYIDDETMEDDEEEAYEESFLDERSVGSQSENGVEEPMDQDDEFQDEESVSTVDQDMAGSYPEVDNTAELEDSQDDYDDMDGENNALVRARLRASQKAATPMKKFAAGNDWTAALVRTVSPKKQDRAMLKSLIQFQDDSRSEFQPSPTKRGATDTRGFATSIDLMNSLFGQTKSPIKPAMVPTKAKGFEWPYAKIPKTSDSDMKDMTAMDRQFYESFKPSWGHDGTLVYSTQIDPVALNKSPSRRLENNGLLAVQRGAIVSEGRDVRFAKISNENSAEHLQIQQSFTRIDTADNVPYAELRGGFQLSAFCDNRATRDPAANHEKLVWELASILWDPIMVPEQLEQVPSIRERIRKDKLSAFWQGLVSPASNRTIPLAKSHEEKAIASLSAHNVPDACAYLIAGKNFHLATLISVIGTKDSIRKDIKQQISDWKQSKVLSEFSQPVRTLYELLAGNVCICDGTGKVPGEDRIDSFIISKRFGLDWRQAFGLRLWYGTLPTEPIESAIESFATDLNAAKETTRPHPWYVEEKVPTLWKDKDQAERDDLLWGLLKLHTFHNVSIDEVLLPANSQLSPLNFRLTWQLSQALTSANVVTLVDDSKPDEITLSFAAQLTSEGSWLDAVFVLLHLSDSDVRIKSIQKHLAQFAGRIGSEESQSFVTLTTQLKIPAPWIWKAKALYMRSVERNPRAEVECLIKAGSFNEAHRTFAREVAPKSIIELDYDVLQTLLDGFKGMEHTISEWPVGGEVYLDFLQIVGPNLSDADQITILDRLVKSLPRVVQAESQPSFMERVAVETISATVAKKIVAMGKRGQRVDLPKVLELPLTEDRYLNHTVDLSIQYYRSIFAK